MSSLGVYWTKLNRTLIKIRPLLTGNDHFRTTFNDHWSALSVKFNTVTAWCHAEVLNRWSSHHSEMRSFYVLKYHLQEGEFGHHGSILIEMTQFGLTEDSQNGHFWWSTRGIWLTLNRDFVCHKRKFDCPNRDLTLFALLGQGKMTVFTVPKRDLTVPQ